MKNLKGIYILTFLFSTLAFVSCENNSTGEDTTPENSTGDYWPSAINNQWVLNQDGTEVAMKIISTDNFNGATYYKFNQMVGMDESISADASIWLNKNEGDYSIKMGDINLNVGGITGSITGYQYIFFKDYLDVHQTWVGTFDQTTTYNIDGVPPIKMTVNYKGTILEKGTSLKVKGIDYVDVIKFRMHQDVSIMGEVGGTIDVDYWMSKNVGIIKMTSEGSITELVSYVVNK